MSHKKIIITSFHPLISRNILQTEILNLLKDSGVKIYILCFDYKKDYFIKEFTDERVAIIAIPEKSFNRREKLFNILGTYLLRTSTIYYNRKERYWRSGGFISYYFSLFIYQTFARFRFSRKLYRMLYDFFYQAGIFSTILDETVPDVVFSTDIFNAYDVRLISDALKKRIKTVGMVRSWDNMTNKTILPVLPDQLIVHNQIIRQEAVFFNDFPENKIFVSGVPQFDYYVDYKPKMSRQEFCAKLGFDPSRKIVMFAPTGKKFIASDHGQLQALVSAVSSGDIPGAPNILVRYPPGDKMDIDLVKIPDQVKVCVDQPGVGFNRNYLKDREMSKDDMYWLSDSLYHTDILISAGSTLCIDIAAFDKPIILPAFDGQSVHYFQSVLKMYDKYHYHYLLRTNAGKFVTSKAELVEAVNNYTNDQSLDRENRQKLLKEQVWQFDGKACKRIADFLIEAIRK